MSELDTGNLEKENLDPRFIRSRRDLKSAFMYLINRKEYSKISIADITNKAGLARPTFYLHYLSKEQLLADCFEDIENKVLKKVKQLRKKNTLNTWRKTANILLFIEFEKNTKLIKTLIQVNQAILINSLININKPLFHEYMKFHNKSMPKNMLDLYISFYAAGYSELVSKWITVNRNNFTPEDMGQFSYNLTTKYLEDIVLKDKLVSHSS